MLGNNINSMRPLTDFYFNTVSYRCFKHLLFLAVKLYETFHVIIPMAYCCHYECTIKSTFCGIALLQTHFFMQNINHKFLLFSQLNIIC